MSRSADLRPASGVTRHSPGPVPLRRNPRSRLAVLRVGRATSFVTLLLLVVPCVSCTSIRPAGVVGRAAVTKPEFSHAELDAVQSRFVDAEGRVDYQALAKDPADLERYYLAVASYSPDSHPEMFATSEDELAYWINAYNAAVLKTVLSYYPIASVTDVVAPFPLWVFSDKIGFFLLQRVILGGEPTSLYALENSVIRRRYREPRVHFALNCASRGCPRLPQEAFAGDQLDEQLEQQTRAFFAEERNLRIDHEAGVVHLSRILDWYEDDFTDWLAEHHPGRPATLIEYVSLYVPPERAAELSRARDYELRFLPYDWALNDR